MEALVQIRFTRQFGLGTPHICDPNGRVLLASHAQGCYVAGEVAGYRPDIARAICKAGYAVIVESETK